jgi:hypothetical protein
MFKLRFFYGLMAVVVLSGTTFTQQTQYGVPISRLKRLRRGFNASLIYYGSYSVSTYKELKSRGYDHVRVTCKPSDIYNSDGSAKSGGIDKFKQVAANAKAAGIGAMVCVHKNRSYSVPHLSEKFVKYCHDFAKKLADTDPEYLFLETVNEPNVHTGRPGDKVYDTSEWNEQMAKAALGMRENAPHHTIVMSASTSMKDTTRKGGDSQTNWDQIDALTTPPMTLPEGLTNIIMTTHYYRPMTFTHQAVGPNFFPEIRNISYPADEVNCANAINKVSSPYAEQNIKDYLWLWSDRGHFEEQMKKVAIWRAKHNNIYVHIGEFGANGNAKMGRDLYFKDIVNAMTKYNIGWAHWCQSYGPNRSWVGLDKELPEYDPTYTGLPAASIDDLDNVYHIENDPTRRSLQRSLAVNDFVGTRLFDINGRLIGSTANKCHTTPNAYISLQNNVDIVVPVK